MIDKKNKNLASYFALKRQVLSNTTKSKSLHQLILTEEIAVAYRPYLKKLKFPEETFFNLMGIVYRTSGIVYYFLKSPGKLEVYIN